MAKNRYVILHHSLLPGEHWDLMLELGSTLATWRLDAKPAGRASLPVNATRIGNHRKRYLVYEGPLSGDRGRVTRFDHGRYRLLENSEDRWLVHLTGQLLSGRFSLIRLPNAPPDAWLLTTA